MLKLKDEFCIFRCMIYEHIILYEHLENPYSKNYNTVLRQSRTAGKDFIKFRLKYSLDNSLLLIEYQKNRKKC